MAHIGDYTRLLTGANDPLKCTFISGALAGIKVFAGQAPEHAPATTTRATFAKEFFYIGPSGRRSRMKLEFYLVFIRRHKSREYTKLNSTVGKEQIKSKLPNCAIQPRVNLPRLFSQDRIEYCSRPSLNRMRQQNRQSDPDTNIGGPLRNFPKTHHSAIVAVRSEDPQQRRHAFNVILESYWKPVYKYIRIKWRVNNEDGKDLTQGFFANVFEKNHLANYDTSRASFQTFLRTCVDGYVANQQKSQQRLKRGGGLENFSLDFQGAETELALHPPATNLSPEEYFQREWTRNLFSLAVEALRLHYKQPDKAVRFQIFEKYDLDDSPEKISYSSLAEEFGLTTTTVNNYLAAARRDFRKILIEKLRQLTASDEEFRIAARQLLGIDVR
jgi:RNA polymerase sigma factor (sigma-70 family)